MFGNADTMNMLCTLYDERMEDGPIFINSKQSVANGVLPVATPE